MTGYRLIQGDAREVMAGAKRNSIDAIVTDPPYGLSKEPRMVEVLTHWLNGDDYEATGGGFMGKTWDSFVPGPAIWREAFEVLKPGGHLLVFAGTRTVDLMGLALRLAGFEIRDQIAWLYGQGFPKSHNVGLSIDKLLGHERERVEYAGGIAPGSGNYGGGGTVHQGEGATKNSTDPISAEAHDWNGWGTALKPAMEPIIVARKPLKVPNPKTGRMRKATVAENVMEWHVGAYNIDGCRIAATEPGGRPKRVGGPGGENGWGSIMGACKADGVTDEGRWPSNVILDEDAAAVLDEQSGTSKSTKGKPRGTAKKGMFANSDFNAVGSEYNDAGGASRFFYVAKTSTAEREAGCDALDATFAPTMGDGIGGVEHNPATAAKKKNTHPTVKPIELMRYLVRLVTPPNGVVLDPFMGSASTGIAARLEGARFVGIEREDEYMAIARARMAHWTAAQAVEQTREEVVA